MGPSLRMGRKYPEGHVVFQAPIANSVLLLASKHHGPVVQSGFCALTQSHTTFQNHYGGMRQYTRPQWPTQVLNLYSSGCPTWRQPSFAGGPGWFGLPFSPFKLQGGYLVVEDKPMQDLKEPAVSAEKRHEITW